MPIPPSKAGTSGPRPSPPERLITTAATAIAASVSAATCTARRCTLGTESLAREELLELHRGAHIALELQLAGHIGARRVLLASDDLLEDLLRSADRAVGSVGHAVLDRDGAVRD